MGKQHPPAGRNGFRWS